MQEPFSGKIFRLFSFMDRQKFFRKFCEVLKTGFIFMKPAKLGLRNLSYPVGFLLKAFRPIMARYPPIQYEATVLTFVTEAGFEPAPVGLPTWVLSTEHATC